MEVLSFVIKPDNASIITNFVDEALRHEVVKTHLAKKDARAREAYVGTIQNMKVYEISGIPSDDTKNVYFRLQDIMRFLDMSKSNATQRIAMLDEHEALQGKFGESKPLWFLNQVGLIKFMFRSRTAIAEVFSTFFANIIIKVNNNDPEMFASIVRQTIEEDEDPAEFLKFIDKIEERFNILKDMYDEEREKNARLEQQNQMITEKIHQSIDQVFYIEQEKLIIEESIDQLQHELKIIRDDELLHRMMRQYMSPVYVYLLSYDDVVRTFKKLVIPADYQKQYDHSKKYEIVGYHALGFKITTMKPKAETYSQVHYIHGSEMFKQLADEIKEMISIEKEITKTSVYVYGSYDIVSSLFEEYKTRFPEKKVRDN